MAFRHCTPIQIRFADLDALNHVNNANFLSYIELARIAYFQQITGGDMGLGDEGLILAKATVDFKQPIRLNDQIVVYTRCSKIGNKSFDLEYEILNEKGDGQKILMASAHTVIVCIDYTTGKTVAVPQAWRDKMIAYEAEGSIALS
ncbi:MAG: thioesterase family protein [Chitinophagales bacterium]|nr:thioesterase family protein [Chitinophagales bacterium]